MPKLLQEYYQKNIESLTSITPGKLWQRSGSICMMFIIIARLLTKPLMTRSRKLLKKGSAKWKLFPAREAGSCEKRLKDIYSSRISSHFIIVLKMTARILDDCLFILDFENPEGLYSKLFALRGVHFLS